jgi:hypothetical protein
MGAYDVLQELYMTSTRAGPGLSVTGRSFGYIRLPLLRILGTPSSKLIRTQDSQDEVYRSFFWLRADSCFRALARLSRCIN